MENVSPFIHPHALVETDFVGSNTRIWAFAHILPGAVIGSDCNVCNHCFIEGRVRLGNGCVIKNGVSLWNGVTLEDGVFIGPHAVFTNDHLPRARVHHPDDAKTTILTGASIGAGAVIIAPCVIGRYAFVGAGAVVTRNVPDHAMVLGNPARFYRWICRCARFLNFDIGPTAICTCGDVHVINDRMVSRQSMAPISPSTL